MFSNLKLSIKLLMTPAAVILLMLISGAFSFWGIRTQQQTIREMHSVRFANYIKAGNVMNDIDGVHNRLYRLIVWSSTGFDQKKIETESKDVQNLLTQTVNNVKSMSEDRALKAEEQKFVAEILASVTAYSKTANDTLDMMGPDINAVMMFLQQADDNFVIFEKKFSDFIKLEAALNDASYTQSISASQRVLVILVGVIIFSLLAAIVLSYLINRGILAPIRGTVVVIESMAGGDLTKRIDVSSSDEIGNMARHINGFVDSLQETFRSFANNALKLASASSELSNTSQQMMRGVADQSNRSSQIATSSSQMSQTVMDIAKNASDIAASASETTQMAKEGEQLVDRSVTEVNEIATTVSTSAGMIESLGERSKQIGEIVNVIKDIADQTNLLALNAAIEAARAGEQGRGFAVVADEVRKLAERTAKATSEIAAMINTIQQEVGSAVTSMGEATNKVEIGTQDVTKAGTALASIVRSVDGLGTMIHQIASATEEMATVSETINNDIESIARVSHETSASSEQIAHASTDLAQLASDLQGMIGHFKV